ncbi:hypothetical protein ACWEQ3_46375 [Streptomyces mirabilis]
MLRPSITPSPVHHPSELPASSVPAALDRGHLYSPTLDITSYGISYRSGDDFEPMSGAPRGDGKAFARWWNKIASINVPDYLGLRVGDEITIQHVTCTGPGTVVETCRFGALIRYPMPAGASKPHAEMYVRRRNLAGHWYR